MDLFSHALLPYLLGRISKIKKEYLTALVIGGIAPDFDIFILWINSVYPTFFLITHRGITHSFFFGFFTALIVFHIAASERVKAKVLRFADFNPVISLQTMAFVFAGVIIHLFLDFITTRGVPLFYPIETARYSAEIFFYTDIYLMIISLFIVIYLFKRPLQKNTAITFLIVFIFAFAVLGGIRIAEKNSAEEFFHADVKTYPTMNPFDWYALSENRNEISVFEYNGLEKNSPYNKTVSRLNILMQGDGLDVALRTSGELSQVKMFKWRAHAVAINASFGNGAWCLEYYDPVQRAEMRDVSETFKKVATRLTSVKVMLQGEKTVVS
jgi:inner membrane protein